MFIENLFIFENFNLLNHHMLPILSSGDNECGQMLALHADNIKIRQMTQPNSRDMPRSINTKITNTNNDEL